jgi:hypothetical protein
VFGSGTREQREKVYQDAESEKTYFGRLSPGPCTYNSQARHCMHITQVTTKRSVKSVSIASAACKKWKDTGWMWSQWLS